MQVRSDQAIDADRCVALDSVPGVQGAVALRFTDSVISPVVRPDNPIPVVETAGDAATLLGASTAPQPGLLLPDGLATVIGAERGSNLPLTSGEQVAVRGIYNFPEDGRDSRLASSAVAGTADHRPFDECWIHVWPVNDKLLDLVLYAADSGADDAAIPEVNQLNTTLGTDPGFDAQFRERGTQLIAAAGVGLFVLVGFAAVWMRRLEISTSLQLGVRKRHLILQHVVEGATWVLPASILLGSIGFAIVMTSARPPDASALLEELTVHALAAVAGVLVGGALAVLTVNPNLQYTYLKSR